MPRYKECTNLLTGSGGMRPAARGIAASRAKAPIETCCRPSPEKPSPRRLVKPLLFENESKLSRCNKTVLKYNSHQLLINIGNGPYFAYNYNIWKSGSLRRLSRRYFRDIPLLIGMEEQQISRIHRMIPIQDISNILMETSPDVFIISCIRMTRRHGGEHDWRRLAAFTVI